MQSITANSLLGLSVLLIVTTKQPWNNNKQLFKGHENISENYLKKKNIFVNRLIRRVRSISHSTNLFTSFADNGVVDRERIVHLGRTQFAHQIFWYVEEKLAQNICLANSTGAMFPQYYPCRSTKVNHKSASPINLKCTIVSIPHTKVFAMQVVWNLRLLSAPGLTGEWDGKSARCTVLSSAALVKYQWYGSIAFSVAWKILSILSNAKVELIENTVKYYDLWNGCV